MYFFIICCSALMCNLCFVAGKRKGREDYKKEMELKILEMEERLLNEKELS